MLSPVVARTIPAPFQSAVSAIFAWDLSFVKKVLLREHPMSEQKAGRLIEEYRKFMAINLVHKETPHPVSRAVDNVWHAHVLSTEDYARFCTQVFGGFVHHTPIFDMPRLRRDYKKITLPHLTELFGTPSAIWLRAQKVCVAQCDCRSLVN